MAAGSLVFGAKGFAWVGSGPEARTTAGRIRGVVEGGVNVFRGIPYGADTAKTRFRAPAAVAPWTEVKDCTRFTTMAPQLTGAKMGAGGGTSSSGVPGVGPDVGVQSEDCLNLNVWTRGRRDGRARPVLVYFHGGGFNNGTVNNAVYDGKRLCERGDVVVVTVNHRLNAFGYLYLGDLVRGDLAREYGASGNVGQMDLILALRWVKENIEEFGGDPGRVLIFGQSGGGAKCATLMAMEGAVGLFQRVLTMSGQQVTAKPRPVATAVAKDVLDRLGVRYGVGADLGALKTLSMEEIQEAARVSSEWLPVRDGVALERDPFDPGAPGMSAGVPMILGNTHDETVTRAAGPTGVLTWEEAPGALKASVGQYLGSYTPEEVIREYRELYPERDAAHVVVAAAVAFRAWPGQVIEADRRAADARSQPHTWVYRMDWRMPTGMHWAVHTIDIPFLFDNVAMAPGLCGTTAEEVARAQPLAEVMAEMLIAYARTGNPNHAGMPDWGSYGIPERRTMIFDEVSRVERDPRGAEREFAAAAHYRQPGT